jgi:hypothetical protein
MVFFFTSNTYITVTFKQETWTLPLYLPFPYFVISSPKDTDERLEVTESNGTAAA